MSWQDRLRPSIILTSPGEQRFEARWRGGEVSVSKRINRVAHPDQDGETVQDLGMGSWDIPLTFYFDGPDCDLKAQKFSRAVSERGIWSVVHPVSGLLRLVPVKVSIALNPLESGNVVEISGEWFSPADDEDPFSAKSSGAAFSPQPAGAADGKVFGKPGGGPSFLPDNEAEVERAVKKLEETAQEDAEQVVQHIFNHVSAWQFVVQEFRAGLNAVKATIRNANARITAIMGAINDLTLRPYLDMAAASGAVIQLMESPGLFFGSVANRVSMFVKLGNRIITDLPAAAVFSWNQIVAAYTGELWINAVLIGMGKTVTEGLPLTRAEAISTLRQFRDFSARATAALDALAKATASASIGKQYFPRALSAEAILTLNAAISRYLLAVAFDLKTEKRIVLERPTSPMLLAIREYGASAAGADAAYDLLCRSNNLHGKELLLLDRGREVVIYA
jgi:hypothetical protein